MNAASGGSGMHPDETKDRLTRVDSDPPRLAAGRAIRLINEELGVEGSPSGFLSAAENTWLAASDDFTAKLGVMAIQIARRRNATAVDRQDVLDADSSLRENITAERRSWVLGFAGFAGGGGVAALVALLLAPKPVPNSGYWWASIVVLGAAAAILFYISYPWQGKRRP
jgi:hypothetical protein